MNKYQVWFREKVAMSYPTSTGWGDWTYVSTYSSLEDAEDSMETFQRINKGDQYKIEKI